jgi:hypothetical protein
MKIAMAALARISLLLCAGLAGGALADSNTPSSDPQCVKTRCFTPSCYHQYAGGYFMHCPDGNHPLPTSEQTVPTEADRQTDQRAPSRSPRESGQPHPSDLSAAQDVGGDWELRLGASPKPLAVLRLRPSSTGSVQGTLEQSLGAQSNRVSLEDVAISGTTISYSTPNGRQFHGTLSSDHQTIVGDAGSPTWTRVRPLSQALADDAESQ